MYGVVWDGTLFTSAEGVSTRRDTPPSTSPTPTPPTACNPRRAEQGRGRGTEGPLRTCPGVSVQQEGRALGSGPQRALDLCLRHLNSSRTSGSRFIPRKVRHYLEESLFLTVGTYSDCETAFKLLFSVSVVVQIDSKRFKTPL